MTEPGRTLGRYRLEELLGRGGMAEVYRATDEKLGRTVAVKVILAVHARDPRFLERFLREARLVAALDHPNILPVYDYGDAEGVPYLVMPFLPGGTLRDRMGGTPFPLGRAVSWVRQLADALDAAHAAGILHRDVKPANVLVRADERLALADFGIAKMLESTTGLTVTGMVVGTPIYMAPEQAQGRPATPASDRYALAVLAYELLSGKPPFDGESALSLMHQHVTVPAPPLSAWVRGLPDGLDPVFERALAKEPGRRPPTCLAFADGLAAFVSAGEDDGRSRATRPLGPVGVTAPTVCEPTPKRLAERERAGRGPSLTSEPTISTAPRPSRRSVLVAGGAAAGLAALALAWFLVPRARPAEPPAPAARPATEAAASAPRPVPTPPAPAAVDARPVPPPPPPAMPGPERLGPGPGGATPPEEEPERPRDDPGARGGEAVGGVEEGLRVARLRLDPLRNGGRRPRREDFEAALRAARTALGSASPAPGARALELYALGGVAYTEGRKDEAARRLAAALALPGRAGRAEPGGPLAAATLGRTSGGWGLALSYGDPLGEAERLLAEDLGRDPGDAGALLGRAVLRRMEGRGEEAIADATAVLAGQPPASLAAPAAELLGDEHAARGRFEEAVRWYREAAFPQGPVSARAGWEGGRILEEQLGRRAEARELYAVACRAGNREACRRSGEGRLRPRLFPRRR